MTTVRDGFTQPNYPAFAPDGTLYLSDSGHWGRDDGLVYRLGADGTLDVFSDRLPHFPNGCAVSPDGRYPLDGRELFAGPEPHSTSPPGSSRR